MRLYISKKRITISSGGGCFWEVMKGKGSNRRFSLRSVLPIVLIVGVLLPFLFISAAFLALEGASKCASSTTINCIGMRFGPSFFSGSDTSERLGNELRRTFLDAKEEARDAEGSGIDASLRSFNDLVAHIVSNRQDLRTLVSKTKDMLLKMDRKVRSAKAQELIYKQLASIGIPKSMHCLSLRLADEYSINALARSPLPPPEYISRLSNASYNHVVVLTDNVLAALVTVCSTVRSSRQPEKMVFHVVTDKKTYAPMHALFALNPVWPAVVEVKGLHHYDWPVHVNSGVMEMMEIHRMIREHYYYDGGGGEYGRLEALRPKHLSLLNYLRIYLPELFPELEKIIFLDDDIVVQRDLSPLWTIDLEGKVIGAVSSRDVDSERNGCLGGRYEDYLNFSSPLISSVFDRDRCAWLYGMNVLDLKAWRRTNITDTYQHWLKLNRESGITLWHLGELPPALIAFHGHVHPIDPSWHVSGLGLGHQLSKFEQKMVRAAAVIHFSGPAKPWLEIGFPQLRRLWSVNINFTNEYIRSCSIIE